MSISNRGAIVLVFWVRDGLGGSFHVDQTPVSSEKNRVGRPHSPQRFLDRFRLDGFMLASPRPGIQGLSI